MLHRRLAGACWCSQLRVELMGRLSVVLVATVLAALSAADAAPFEGMIRGMCLHMPVVRHSATSISSFGQRGCGGPSLTAPVVRRGLVMPDSTVSPTPWFSGSVHGEDQRASKHGHAMLLSQSGRRSRR